MHPHMHISALLHTTHVRAHTHTCRYTIKNLRVAICKLGFLFWGAKGTVPLPYSLNDRFEAHDVFKAAHLMGVASIKGAIWTGHSPNVLTGGSNFGSAKTATSAHLFEQYDLGMATVLKVAPQNQLFVVRHMLVSARSMQRVLTTKGHCLAKFVQLSACAGHPLSGTLHGG